jgi:hypothetical protein
MICPPVTYNVPPSRTHRRASLLSNVQATSRGARAP